MRVAGLQRLANKKFGKLLVNRTVIDSRRIIIEGYFDVTITADQFCKWLIVFEMNAAERCLYLRLVLLKRLANYIKGKGETSCLISSGHRKRRCLTGTFGVEEKLVLLKGHTDKACINRRNVDLDLVDQCIRIKGATIDCGGNRIIFRLVK